MHGEFDRVPTAVAFGNSAEVFLVLYLLICLVTSRARLICLAQLASVMFRKAGVAEEESVAQGAEDVGLSFVLTIGALFTSTLETHRSAAGMVTGVVCVESTIAFVAPVGSVDKPRERSASIVMGIGFYETNLMWTRGSLVDECEATSSAHDDELIRGSKVLLELT